MKIYNHLFLAMALQASSAPSLFGQVDWRVYPVMIPVGREAAVDISPGPEPLTVLYFWDARRDTFLTPNGAPTSGLKLLAERYRQQQWGGVIKLITVTRDSLAEAKAYFELYFDGVVPFPVLSIREFSKSMQHKSIPRVVIKAGLEAAEELAFSAHDYQTFDDALRLELEQTISHKFVEYVGNALSGLESRQRRQLLSAQKLKTHLDRFMKALPQKPAGKVVELYAMLGDLFKAHEKWSTARRCCARAFELGAGNYHAQDCVASLVKPGSLAIEGKDVRLSVGERRQFHARGLNAFDEEVRDLPLSWRLKENIIGELDPGGAFRATRAGLDSLFVVAQDQESGAIITVVAADTIKPGLMHPVRHHNSNLGSGVSSIVLLGGAIASLASSFHFDDQAKSAFEALPLELSEARVQSWGDFQKRQTRRNWARWTALNTTVAALPFLFDWMDRGPRIGKWWTAGSYFAGAAAFATVGVVSKRRADDALDNLETQYAELSEMRVTEWGRYNKFNEQARAAFINAGIDAFAAIAAALWYDRGGERLTSNGLRLSYLDSTKSTALFLGFGRQAIAESKSPLSLALQKKF